MVATKKTYPHYVWAVFDGKFKGNLDIRRYAYSHNEAIAIVNDSRKKNWNLFKLVRVNKYKSKD